MADSKEKLFSEFPPVSTKEWMEKVTIDLKGADFEKKLVWKTNEGFNVRPFYRSEDIEGMKTTDSLPGEFPFVRGTKTNNNWYVRQDIEVTTPQKANEKALEVLEKGITSLCFAFSGKHFDAKSMETLFNGIQLDCIEINFRICFTEAAKITKLLVDYVKAAKINPDKIKGSINFDPFKRMMTKGFDIDIDIKAVMKEIFEAAAELKNLKVFGANPYLFNNAGAYCAQELGFGLAYGNEYLTLGTEAGLPAKAVAKKVKFNFGIGSNYFMEIAKFRAGRLLWSQIVNAYLSESDCKCACKMDVHAKTSEWNQTVYDAYMNLLRSQTETMSASIAGVDSISVTPFDNAYKSADNFSERIARNQQLLLKEEAHFDKVVDASAGSYYIENLTASIADQAWKIFLTVNEKGGFYAALKEGFIQTEVNASNEKRLAAISCRREILLGTNQYPNFNEQALEKVEEGKKDCTCCCTEKGSLATLKFERGSSAFDTLRLATEKSGKRPKVFMLTIGKLSMRLARAQFSSNFFACAGYEIIDNLGFETPEEGVAAARKSKADIIVICSSDEEYAALAPKTFATIGGGKELFVVAGAPECTEDLKAIGINNFVNIRTNVLETLQGFNKQLGIN
ncbi:MAG: methylmalonyl-CoA mutase small subunit [Bacteroidales bacterium]|nr:methylmalonyl-CoA mutase small subunit [Bacteroidales bacterium]